MAEKTAREAGRRVIAENRKARHDYLNVVASSHESAVAKVAQDHLRIGLGGVRHRV